MISFDVTWKHADAVLLRALNAVLPPDIALQDLSQQPGFHPRYDARSRVYVYTLIHAPQRQPLWQRTAWHVWGDLNTEVLNETAQMLVGEHDFATFGNAPQGNNTVRHILRSAWQMIAEPFGWRLRYAVEGNAFLEHMVRRMVGMQMDVARAHLTLDDFAAAFAAADLSQSGTVAPPQGLVLEQVKYP